ncbi:MAG: threonine-phosphate decarboxylase CobD [Deltaproteobacteria bacterium]|nr:threonine-phosphate decarboxylase CobD [Deltaproteobacteria bacterium]
MRKLNHTHGGNITEISKRYDLRAEDVIDFSASINPLEMSKKARQIVIDGLDSVLHYPEQFAETLTSQISDFHGIPEECILAGNGSTELIYLIPRVFKPKKALMVIPTFSEYRSALELVGCNTDTFLLSEENGFKLEVERLIGALEGKYDILYICNPGNPTGALVSKDAILEIVDKASNYGTLSIVDEAFIDFVEDESVKKAAIERPNLIVLRSMTKFFGIPGMRVGFAISSKENIDRMMVYKEPWSINSLGSIAAIESLKDTGYMEESRRFVEKERDHLFSSLADIRWLKPFPSVANYILARIKNGGLDADMLFDILAKKGLLIRSCTSFEGLGNRFFRVAVRKREENERLANGLRQVQ